MSQRPVLILLIIGLVFSWSAGAQGIVYFSVLDDLPLPPGMTENLDESIDYDSGGVRIAQAQAAGPQGLLPHKITDFYAETLPALGWDETGPGTYRRGEETLTFTVTQSQNNPVLTIRLGPSGHPPPIILLDKAAQTP